METHIWIWNLNEIESDKIRKKTCFLTGTWYLKYQTIFLYFYIWVIKSQNIILKLTKQN